jgi:hypothetical protein
MKTEDRKVGKAGCAPVRKSPKRERLGVDRIGDRRS